MARTHIRRLAAAAAVAIAAPGVAAVVAATPATQASTAASPFRIVPSPPPAVTVREFPVPGGTGGSIVSGPGGTVWFTTGNGAIATISAAGVVRQFQPAQGGAITLAAGPDGNVWFLGESAFQVFDVGRVTPNGQITTFPIPPFQGHTPIGRAIIAAGGDLWFTADTFAGRQTTDSFIGRVTTAGVITEFATPTPVSSPGAITRAGSDLWFTESNTTNIGRVSLP